MMDGHRWASNVLCGVLALPVLAHGIGFTERDLFSMSLEDLANLPITHVGSLATTSKQKLSAANTHITEDMIRQSGARSLDELFEIYVPNVQVIRHDWQVSHLGTRGTVSDRDNKYLLMVNGRIMNQRTQLGAFSERDLPQLGDIRAIDYIRGAGSVIYGPGAISNVISITTHNATTFLGTSTSFRQGLVEQYSSFDVRHGVELSGGGGLFVYYGVTEYDGASEQDAPLVYGRSFSTTDGGNVTAGSRYRFRQCTITKPSGKS